MSAAAPPTKRGKYSAYTLEEKVWLLNHADNNKSLKAEDLASALALHVNEGQPADRVPRTAPSKQSVNDWRKAANSLRQQLAERSSKGQAVTTQRNKAARYPELEEALFVWFRQQQSNDMTITEQLLREQAQVFGAKFNVHESFIFSSGWMQKFKKRYGIKSYALHGEAGDANAEGIKLAQTELRNVLEPFKPEDVYNQDETGIFWRQVPARTLATGKRAGNKKIKERVTVSLTCNVTGTDKRPLMLIGKAARPRSFPRSFEPKRVLGVTYANNKTAWMTGRGAAQVRVPHENVLVVLGCDHPCCLVVGEGPFAACIQCHVAHAPESLRSAA
jgi:hypothetical protein